MARQISALAFAAYGTLFDVHSVTRRELPALIR
jgi:hypothetical protein